MASPRRLHLVHKIAHFSQVLNHFSSYSHTQSIHFTHFSYSITVVFPDFCRIYDYSFPSSVLLSNFLLFTTFLYVIHFIPLCFSLVIVISSYHYSYRCTLVNRSLHWSERFYPLQCTGQTHYIFYYILLCYFFAILLIINTLSFVYIDCFSYLYKIY